MTQGTKIRWIGSKNSLSQYDLTDLAVLLVRKNNSHLIQYNMKKTLLVFFMLITGPMAMAGSGDKSESKKDKTELTEAQQVRLTEMEARVEEIKAMDLMSMSKNERKDIREELKEMKAEARATGNGVYISVGAIIVVLLLIILLT
jgi:hypothetical protein